MTETQALVGQVGPIIERLLARLETLDEATLNSAPAWEGANSPYVIVAHVLGNARAWVLGIACGEPVRRDRPAEFASRGRCSDLRAAWAELAPEIEHAAAALKPADLDRTLLPSRELWGEGEPHEVSVRQAFLHVIEHASIHLGQMQTTLDLMKSEGAR